MSARPDSESIDGLTAGVIAGGAMLVSEMVIAGILGASALSPIRLSSSIVLGPAALSGTYPLVTALAVGIGAHLLLSVLFGTIAFQALALVGRRNAPAWALLAFGLAYGGLLWAVNFLAIGTFALRQFSAVDLLWNGAVPHVLFFGLVLGICAAVGRPRPGGGRTTER